MPQEIDINDNRLIEFVSKDDWEALLQIYKKATKKQKQLIDDLFKVSKTLSDWTSLLGAEESLPYHQTHRIKYVCGMSQPGARISKLCNHQGQQRYMGQWLDHKSLVMSNRKYVKFVRIATGAKYFFNYQYKGIE